MSKKVDTIECEEHGTCETALVCCHLADSLDNEAVGFYQSYIDLFAEKYEYNAWCKSCETSFAQVGYEWNDLLEKQADIKVLCMACFEDLKDKQLALNPADMSITYVPDNKNIDKFFELADAHIDLGNKNQKEKIEDTSESFLFAASRFSAFEATLMAKDIEKNKAEIIDYYALRFKEMFVDNLNDYIANKKTYLKED